MTIRKGEDWGSPDVLDADAPIVSNDRQLAALFTVEKSVLDGPKQVGLVGAGDLGGDLGRTVGAAATHEQLSVGSRVSLPIDLGVVTIDGLEMVMAASLVIRQPLWSGLTQAAMNAGFLGSWNVAPSGHPNDGRFDVITATMSASDRMKARSRLPLGTHVPHPSIHIRRLKSAIFSVPKRASVWVDGVRIGRASEVAFRVCPDATHLIV